MLSQHHEAGVLENCANPNIGTLGACFRSMAEKHRLKRKSKARVPL